MAARLVLAVCSAAVLALPAAPRAAPPKAARPNLLVVTFDTTRADRIACYGYAGVRTPSIDRLAREGVLFARTYAPAVQTLPSHASMFTGLFPITQNVVSNGQRLDEDALTLAEVLRSEGYRTGAIVATAPLGGSFNLDQGFQTYDDDFEEPSVAAMLKDVFRFLTFDRVTVRATRPAPEVAALAREWLEDAAGEDEPFFLWIHFIEPHHPYDFHPELEDPGRVEGGGPRNAYGEEERNYVSEIEFADHYLGRVLEDLDRLGLTGETLTAFAADHGESLGEQGYRGHREEVYERIIRVPLVLRFPGVLPAGRRLTTPAQVTDLPPTILSLLKIPFPDDHFQGEDLFSLSERAPRRLFSIAVKLFTRSPIRIAMIEGDLKYVSADRPDREGVFDLAADPDERNNLLAAHPPAEAAGDWRAEIRRWWQQHDRLRPSGFQMTADQRKRLESLGYVE